MKNRDPLPNPAQVEQELDEIAKLLRSNEALWDTLERKLSKPQWRILWELISAYPAPVPREELAERAEQSSISSGYSNNLGALRSLGFIDYPDRGKVIALPVLFLEGS